MASSSKKKKRKKADFQKVKLKAGRKLPKGLNVTNTAFKTRKIQIREQVRENASVPIPEPGKKPLILEDLLRNLNHHNTTARHNSLNGLKDLFNRNKKEIAKNVNQILSSISKLIEDKSSDIRKTSQNVLDLILSTATSSQISPSFPLITAYLNCGMTHIEPAIQRDSLNFLDILLRYFPDLVMKHNPKILSNFLEQISRKTTTNSSSGRTLLINPESRLSGHEWRLQVLKRVQKFMEAALTNNVKLRKRNDVQVKTVYWNSNLVHVNVPKPESFFQEDFPANGFAISRINFRKTQQNIIEDPAELKGFMTSLLPLLIETWVEVRPDQPGDRNGCMLPVNSLEALNVLINILKSLLDCIESYENAEQRLILRDYLRNSFERQFVDYFLVTFPYNASQINLSKKEAKSKKGAGKNPLAGLNLKVLSCNLNLIIIYVFVKLCPTFNGVEKYWATVMKYLIALLENPNYKNVSFDTNIMGEILKSVFQNQNFKDVSEKLLSIALNCYAEENVSSKKRCFLTELLASSLLNPEHHDASSPALTKWLMLLPKELLNEKLSWNSITVLKTMVPRKNDAFLHGLQTHRNKIIELLPKLKIEGTDTDLAQRSVIELLQYIQSFNKNDYEMLTEFVRNESISINVRCYCIKILNLRYIKNGLAYTNTEASLYISFLLSLVLVPLSSDTQSIESCLPLPIKVLDVADSNAWSNQEKIIKEVCLSVNEFENIDQMKAIFLEYMQKLLSSDYVCTLMSAWSIIKSLKDLDLMEPLFNSMKDTYVVFLLSTIFAEMTFGRDKNSIIFAKNNKLISYKIVTILEKITKDIQILAQAASVCLLLSALLQHWLPSKKYLLIIQDILDSFKERFGPPLRESFGWHSLSYELSLKIPNE